MEWMVADAVVREPVSGASSLPTGNFTENCAIPGQNLEDSSTEVAVPQQFLVKFATRINREFSGADQEVWRAFSKRRLIAHLS
jgi:hypothetical protein